ncbi:hypothetical protein GGF32_002192 [Allomyces javanicus]|nr:hypothetical protein GGF32_002192 [Allomyces javanicus]
MSMMDRGTIAPGLQGPTTYGKEAPGLMQTASAQLSKLTGITSLATPVLDTGRKWGSIAYDTFRVYWDAYPILRAFVYVFGALTAIPNIIFATYAAISFGIVATIATVGVAIVEGGILGFGLLFLGPVLFFSFWIALAVVGVFTALFYGLRALSIGLGTTQEITGLRSGITGGTLGAAKNAAAMSADLMEKVEAVVIGREGMPQPVSGRV